MEAFLRRIEVWKDTERRAPPAAAPSCKESYVDGYGDGHAPTPPTDAHVLQQHPRVALHDADTIDLGLALLASGVVSRPLLLILADDCFPGGCVATGSGAQEEALFRRTNLCRSLSMRDYPIRDDEAVYAPRIEVFRRGERHATDPFGLLPPEERRVLDFVACPALRHPMLTPEGRLADADAARLAVKVELVLQLAHRHGHDGVVLGAMGCGAWKCPPDHVAEVMADVLSRFCARVPGAFRRVDFAILRGAEAGYITLLGDGRRDNFDAFLALEHPRRST